MKLLLTALIGFFVLFSAKARFVDDLLSGRVTAEGVVTTFYSEKELSPSLTVRADRVYTDYQRKGFFRIGVLPMGVMEGVVFEVHHPERSENGLAELHDWLGPRATKCLEFRKVSFLIFVGGTNRLESGRARIISDGKWELLDGVRLCLGTNQVEAARATLQLAGQQTGQLIIATTPPLTNDLFARFEFPTAMPKTNP